MKKGRQDIAGKIGAKKYSVFPDINQFQELPTERNEPGNSLSQKYIFDYLMAESMIWKKC